MVAVRVRPFVFHPVQVRPVDECVVEGKNCDVFVASNLRNQRVELTNCLRA